MARLFSLSLLLFAALVMRADSLASARLARELLGPDVWSRVVHIENRRSEPGRPADFHALVFAFENRLWLYDGNEGTQSLSLYEGRLEQDKADPIPLLRVALPNFARGEILPDGAPGLGADPNRPRVRPADAVTLPFGCFIKCIVRWRALQAGPFPPDEANVLAFYFDTSAGPQGHSVLLYRENGRLRSYDPEDGETTRLPRFGKDLTPLQLARNICVLAKPFKARLLALHVPPRPRDKEIAEYSAPPKKDPST